MGLSWGDGTGVSGLVTTLVDGDTRVWAGVISGLASDLSLLMLEVCGSRFTFFSLSLLLAWPRPGPAPPAASLVLLSDEARRLRL